MRVALTGHRPQRLIGREKEIRKWIEEQLRDLAPTTVISGMAQGADQMIAMESLSQNIPLLCAWPYRRDNFHPTEEYIMENAHNVWVGEDYSKDCFWIRDKWMVDHCDVLLVVWDGKPKGGSYITMKYAEEQGKEMRIFPWSEE